MFCRGSVAQYGGWRSCSLLNGALALKVVAETRTWMWLDDLGVKSSWLIVWPPSFSKSSPRFKATPGEGMEVQSSDASRCHSVGSSLNDDQALGHNTQAAMCCRSMTGNAKVE